MVDFAAKTRIIDYMIKRNADATIRDYIDAVTEIENEHLEELLAAKEATKNRIANLKIKWSNYAK